IRSTSPATTLNTGSGTNTINVGSQAGAAPAAPGILDNIQGVLTVQGSGNDTMNVDDTGSSGPKAGTLTGTALTGLGMGASGINYSGLAHLNIALGGGGNGFQISNTASGTTTTVNSGTGSDMVNVRATGGPTFVNTGGGSNVNVVNVGSTEPTA